MAEPTNLSFLNTALLSGCPICVCETTDAELFATQAYPFKPTFTYMNTTITSDFFQLFYSHIEKYPKFEANLFHRGYKSVVDTLMRGMRPKRNFTDFAYLRHYRNVIGGKLRLLYLSADVPSKHVEWFRALHGANVIPMFGTAQTAGVATAGMFYDYASAIENHNVGAPLACNEIKLIDTNPFTVEDKPNPRGSVAIRGSNVSAALWNEDPVALNDGWLTLPVTAEILPNGTFDIIGPLSTITKSDAASGLVLAQPLERTLLSTNVIT
ncbi:hypothetical protein DL89DRAFT_263604 [Linderina pennispora]|uniref:AMP-dependent synthetase/ligase domain-containing protein n=1 Tax=Linderina pennispora TaxID=61395 RepID=A0A1Y1WJ31_9FUNG|nr:uncharacterized protein DL89DRAFT_263604 [Linderina pennispora]ORX73547.1 hypothetical protein DL89DRAFT_263604 [Linderina pennispora]